MILFINACVKKIPELIKAVGLDIYGADVEAIIQECIKEIKS